MTQVEALQHPGHREGIIVLSSSVPKQTRFRAVKVWAGALRFLRRICIGLAALVSRSYVPYLILGLMNRLMRFPIRSSFLCYAGSARYARHYSSKWMENWFKWLPTPIAVFRQGRGWGIVFATPMTEKDFMSPDNRKNLTGLLSRLEFINKLAGIEKLSLAGTLPSFLTKIGFSSDASEVLSKPVKVIQQAVTHVVDVESLSPDVPVILLGGKGQLGSRLHDQLKSQRTNVYVVDIQDGGKQLPAELFGKCALMIDLSRSHVIKAYIDQMWSELIVINETFPEPTRGVVSALRRKGIKVYHISGVSGLVIPSLPFGYKNAVPCCAIHDTSASIKPVITQLGY